jgi:hypothetical protein
MNEKSTSEQNKEALNQWYSESGYQDIKFWVHPSVIKSQEESEAEVLLAVKNFNPATAEPANGQTL